MTDFNYAELERLVDSEDYDSAAAFCRAAMRTEQDPRFWQTQLGYVCFLNENDLQAFFNEAPAIFESLVATNQSDANAHFWLGYIFIIARANYEAGVREVRKALALDPSHPYANFVLAGRDGPDREETIRLLLQVLRRQPSNFRALQQLADVLVASGRTEEARQVLEAMLTRNAHVEQGYGIMNRYINDVLSGATHEQELREEAAARVARLQQ